MISYTTTTLIQQPISKVYALLCDDTQVPLWLKGLQQIETISGKPGQKGFKAKYTFVENNRTIIFYEEITAAESGQSFSATLQSDSLVLEGHTRLEDFNGQTRLVAQQKVRAKSFIMKLLLPFLKSMMRKRQQEDFFRFKQLAEGNLQTADTEVLTLFDKSRGQS